MVLYYSGIGNSEFVGKAIAHITDDEAVNLVERINDEDYSALFSERSFVFVVPVAGAPMPKGLRNYFNNTKMVGNKSIYFVFTTPYFAGASRGISYQIARKKGFLVLGSHDIIIPKEIQIDPRFYPLDEDKIPEEIKSIAEEVKSTATIIGQGGNLSLLRRINSPGGIYKSFYRFLGRDGSKKETYMATNDCVGCGLCLSECPEENITLENGKAVFGSNCDNCNLCMAICPRDAIIKE